MDKINELVRNIQGMEKGSIEYEYAYTDLFNILHAEVIIPITNQFKYQLRGDVLEGQSVAFELMEEIIPSWKGTGYFIALYRTSLFNRMINLVKKMNRNKRKHNTNYSFSISETSLANDTDEDNYYHHIINDSTLVTEMNVVKIDDGQPSLEEILQMFEEKHPTQSGVISTILLFPSDMSQADKSKAFCKYYESDTYTPMIQKRVSRAKQKFKQFILEHNSEIMMA